MSFKFHCPHCDQKIEAEEEWIGQEAECPSCNAKITVPAPSTAQKLKEDERECPFCGEIIKKDAIICRFCREQLDDSTATNKSILENEVNTPNQNSSSGVIMPPTNAQYTEKRIDNSFNSDNNNRLVQRKDSKQWFAPKTFIKGLKHRSGSTSYIWEAITVILILCCGILFWVWRSHPEIFILGSRSNSPKVVVKAFITACEHHHYDKASKMVYNSRQGKCETSDYYALPYIAGEETTGTISEHRIRESILSGELISYDLKIGKTYGNEKYWCSPREPIIDNKNPNKCVVFVFAEQKEKYYIDEYKNDGKKYDMPLSYTPTKKEVEWKLEKIEGRWMITDIELPKREYLIK